MNLRAVAAIYLFEMDRTRRTIAKINQATAASRMARPNASV